jgi:predicted nucleic acid-binding protein
MAVIETARLVVSDAGPINHLDELGCLDLLADFSRIIVPHAVWEEVTRHRPGALELKSVRFEPGDAVQSFSAEVDTLGRLLSLHRGELEALEIAQAISGCIFLTDDTAARLAAQALRILVHGTLGILLRGIRRKQKTKPEILELLESLPKISTLHIRRTLLQEVIRAIEQID